MVRGHRSAMSDTIQRCEGGVDNTSTGSPSSVSDETDPAGVVLVARVVQACVSQDVWRLTLSVPGATSHRRLHQKGDARSYPPHKDGGPRPSPAAALAAYERSAAASTVCASFRIVAPPVS